MSELNTTLGLDELVLGHDLGALVVDANTLIDLAKAGWLDLLLQVPNRAVIVTQEVYNETVLAQPNLPDAVAINAFITENLGQGEGTVTLYNSTIDGVPIFTGTGAGEASIIRLVANFGTAIGGQFGDMMVLGRNPRDDLGSGNSVIGATFTVQDAADFIGSMVVNGLLSPHDFVSAINDLSDAQPSVEKFEDISVSENIRIPVYENEQGLIYTGRFGIGNSNDEQVGFYEIGEPTTRIVLFGEGQVVINSTDTAGIVEQDGVEFTLRFGRLRLEIDTDRYFVSPQEDQCFLAGTPIAMWPTDPSLTPDADGLYDQDTVRAGIWTKPVEEVRDTDRVVSFDLQGNLVPGVVDKLFTNTTSELALLDFADGRDRIHTTPGHRFLTETGDYMEIGHMLRIGGGTARLVDVDGSIVEATGQIIAYSAETAHLFAEAQTKTIAMAGDTVLKEQVEAGWQTYNFEVREHHNYVAEGIRVHNDSILATLQEGDQLVALSGDLTDAAVLRDVNGDGRADFVTLDGFRRDGQPTNIALERVFYAAEGQDFAATLATVLENNAPDGTNASENVFDPGNGNNWNDGTWGDDIEEAFFDDVVNAPGNGTDRATIDGLYSATFFRGVDVSELEGASDIVASPELIAAISDAAQTPDEAASISAWLLGIPAGSVAFVALVAALGSLFDDVHNTTTGTSGADSLTGISTADELNGLAGNDTLTGLAGNDTLNGGDGDDVIGSGDGNDLAFGGNGFDTIAGGTGNDTVDGGNGRDRVSLNQGNDVFQDNDQGGDLGRDTVFGGLGNDTINGGNGDDEFHGEDDHDSIDGGLGNDVIFGGTGFDTIRAGEGADTVTGGNGRDRVFLNQGNDVFHDNGQGGDLGRDTVFGGLGNDTINGGNGGDEFHGEDDHDSIDGGLGNDVIFGGTGFDTIRAGEGADTVTGGNGRDRVFLNQGNDVFQDNGQGGDLGRDTVFGGLGNDTINGGNGDDEFHGEDDHDSIDGGLGNDVIFGGTGFDTIRAGEGADTVTGGNGRDRVFLNQGNDVFQDNGQGGDLGRDRKSVV